MTKTNAMISQRDRACLELTMLNLFAVCSFHEHSITPVPFLWTPEWGGCQCRGLPLSNRLLSENFRLRFTFSQHVLSLRSRDQLPHGVGPSKGWYLPVRCLPYTLSFSNATAFCYPVVCSVLLVLPSGGGGVAFQQKNRQKIFT